MILKRIALILALLILSTSVLACHRRAKPSHDAKVISGSEMQMDDTHSTKAKPVGGGGSKLNKNQW